MKKLTTFLAVMALSIPAPLTFSAPAQAAGNSGSVAFCKDYVATGTDANLNRGECVSLLITQGHYFDSGNSAGGYAAHACSYVQQNYPDIFDLFYDSYSDCVHDGASLLI